MHVPFATAFLAGSLLAGAALAQPRPAPDRAGQPERTGQPERDPAARTVDLRPRFTKGQEVRYVMVLESKKSDAGDDDSSSRQEIGLLLRCTATDPEKGATLELVYESLKASLHTGLVDTEFDSSKPPNPDDIYDAALRSMVGLKVPVTIAPDGNVTSAGGGTQNALTAQFTGADIIRSVMGPIFSPKKGQPTVRVGETWKTESEMHGLMGRMRLEMTHSLASYAGGKAVIETSGKALLDPSEGAGAPLVRITDSTIQGRTVWNADAGLLDEHSSRQRFVIDALVNEQKISTTQDMTVNVTRRK
ncbi:MAG: hypothetical protein SFY69_04020 [Planctomycetota bacterium]|nr:hypothetical protein [Planctomycetota bacterium]